MVKSIIRTAGPNRSPALALATRLAVRCLLILVVATVLSCSTFYYKQFVVSGTPRSPSPAIRMQDMWCFFHVDAITRDPASFTDSTYKVSVSLLRAAAEDCSPVWQELFATVHLERFHLKAGERDIWADSLPRRGDSLGSCWVEWRFPDLTISDSVDTIVVDLSLSYMMNHIAHTTDTSVALFRLTGKEREWSDY